MRAIAFLVWIPVWLTACASSQMIEVEPTTCAPKPIGAQVLSNAGHYRVIYQSRPATIPSGELFGLSVWILDEPSGELAEDVELVVDASMPQHQHGMNVRPTQVEGEPGEHRIEGLLFHMPGAWTITFDLERKGVTERAQVVVDVN